MWRKWTFFLEDPDRWVAKDDGHQTEEMLAVLRLNGDWKEVKLSEDLIMFIAKTNPHHAAIWLFHWVV